MIERLRSRLSRLFASRFATMLEVERAELTFYLGYLRDGMTVFDVGANIGELTLLYSRFVGAGVVHSFEPSRECFARLTAVCDAAKLRNVVLNQQALVERRGIANLHVYDEDHLGWNSLAKRPLSDYGVVIRDPTLEVVEATTVDDYCEEHGVKRIDLLKIDVEGAEYQVLLGARRMLGEKRVGCITFEFGQATFDMGNSPSDIKRYLGEVGYRIRNVVSGDPVFPGGSKVESASFSMHVATP